MGYLNQAGPKYDGTKGRLGEGRLFCSWDMRAAVREEVNYSLGSFLIELMTELALFSMIKLQKCS